MRETQKITTKSDGKRKVSISAAHMASEGYDISVCRNGHQTTVVTMDEEMTRWLRDAIGEHLEDVIP